MGSDDGAIAYANSLVGLPASYRPSHRRDPAPNRSRTSQQRVTAATATVPSVLAQDLSAIVVNASPENRASAVQDYLNILNNHGVPLKMFMGGKEHVRPLLVCRSRQAKKVKMARIDDNAYDLTSVRCVPGSVVVGLDYQGRNQMGCSLKVAVPSDLAERIKNIALNAVRVGNNRDNTTPQQRIEIASCGYMAKWQAGSVLVNLDQDDENELRQQRRLPDNHIISPVFREMRLLTVFKDWGPMATTAVLNAGKSNVQINFKDIDIRILMGTWFFERDL